MSSANENAAKTPWEDLQATLLEIDARREAAFGTEWRSEYSQQKGHTVWASVSPTGSMQIAAFGYADYDRVNADFVASTRDDIGFLRELIDKLVKENAEVWANAEKAIQSVQPELMGELTHYEKRQWREWNQQAIAALRTKQESK